MVSLVVAELSHLEAKQCWADYAEALGSEDLHNAYGHHWPREPIFGEHIFEFRIPTCGELATPVGWGSLLWDAAEQVTWLSLGVLPDAQAKGLRFDISAWLRGWAFRNTECAAVGCKILDTNPVFQTWMREKSNLHGWNYAGRITLPEPAYDVHMFLRETWAANA